MPTIFRKTAKGVTEIETRAHRLAPRMRSALIMVDGKRSDADLRPLIQQQPDETLAALAEQGFIEVLAAAPDAAQASRAAPAAAAPARPAADFEARRRAAVRGLNDQLGPLAETLAIKIERARTADELRPLLATAVQVIGNARGRGAAADYAARFAEL
jgi:membrane protein involved in colicin uptake